MHNGKRKRRCANDCVFFTPEKHSPWYLEIRRKICTGKKRRPCVIYVPDDPFIPLCEWSQNAPRLRMVHYYLLDRMILDAHEDML